MNRRTYQPQSKTVTVEREVLLEAMAFVAVSAALNSNPGSRLNANECVMKLQVAMGREKRSIFTPSEIEGMKREVMGAEK